MIDLAYLQAKIKKRLGTTYVNDTHNPSAIIEYINDAIEKISETILRNNFVLTYELVTTATGLTFSIPLQHSTKQIFQGDTELIQGIDWVLGSEALNHTTKIAVHHDTIVFPTAWASTYTILYRWVPTLVAADSPSTYQINLPRPYARAIVPLACYFAFLDVKQSEMAAEQLSFYKEEIVSIAGAFMDPDENRPKRIWANHKF